MSAQPVVVITGASHGVGAGLVTGYRRLGYAVVANSATEESLASMHPLGRMGEIDDVVEAVL